MAQEDTAYGGYLVGEGTTGAVEVDGIHFLALQLGQKVGDYLVADLFLTLEEGIGTFGKNLLEYFSMLHQTPVGFGRAAVCYQYHSS